MTETRFALYAGRALGPSKISETVEIIKGSSWTTIMLGLFHIGWGANSSPDHPQSDAEFFSMTQVLSWAARMSESSTRTSIGPGQSALLI
jgi:hypothetical protein